MKDWINLIQGTVRNTMQGHSLGFFSCRDSLDGRRDANFERSMGQFLHKWYIKVIYILPIFGVILCYLPTDLPPIFRGTIRNNHWKWTPLDVFSTSPIEVFLPQHRGGGVGRRWFGVAARSSSQMTRTKPWDDCIFNNPFTMEIFSMGMVYSPTLRWF